MKANDITFFELAILYCGLGISLWFLWQIKMGRLLKDVLISVLRMTVQLMLVGLFLKYVFQLNNFFLNATWIAMMIVVANLTVIKRTGLSVRLFFFPCLGGLLISTLLVVVLMLVVLIKPTPWYDARYLITFTGMLLGNSLQGNIILLERFYGTLFKRQDDYITYLMMGATRKEALRPYWRDSVQVALSPTVASMMTIGVVSLPGMVTGQLLAGTMPLLAIKYQIAIMIGIFLALTLAAMFTLNLSLRVALNDYDLLKDAAFPDNLPSKTKLKSKGKAE